MIILGILGVLLALVVVGIVGLALFVGIGHLVPVIIRFLMKL